MFENVINNGDPLEISKPKELKESYFADLGINIIKLYNNFDESYV